MDSHDFKHVDIIDYLNTKLQNFELFEIIAIKTTPIMARRGTVGEEVVTYTANNLIESKRTVTVDPNTGVPDWVVTKIDNNFNLMIDEYGNKNEWIVSDSNFKSSYQSAEMEGFYRPIPKEQKFIQVHENITFTRSDGKSYSLEAGSYLNVTNLDKIRVISKRDFEDTYNIITSKKIIR